MKKSRKGYKGIGMNGFIASWYTKIRGKNPDETLHGVRQVCKHLAPGNRVLEIAPGPGYMAVELARTCNCDVTGLDISESFVRIASERAAAAGVNVRFQHGNASELPFPDASFDLAYCVAAFKNFRYPVEAIREMHRVLRPGGQALIYDLRPDLSDAAIALGVRDMNLKGVNAWLTRFTFKHLLTKRAYTREQFAQMAAATPFKSCEILPDGLGFEIILKKK